MLARWNKVIKSFRRQSDDHLEDYILPVSSAGVKCVRRPDADATAHASMARKSFREWYAFMANSTTEQHHGDMQVLASKLLHFTREVGSTMLRLRQESELLEYVIGRLTETYGMEYGTILLHDGKVLSSMALIMSDEEEVFPLQRVITLVTHLMRKGASDVLVITDFERQLPPAEDGSSVQLHTARTLILAPLAAHATPMGAIVLADIEGRSLQSVELEALRLVGQLLAARLREMRLQITLDTTARELASLKGRFDPNSTTDPELGLSNKQHFLDEIQRCVTEAIQTGGHLSLLIVTADRLQSMNQNFGINFGDEVLARIAQEIQGCVRARDMAARYTDEEFWVLLPSTPGIGAVVVAERLRERISALTVQSAHGPGHFSVSIGVACLSVRVTTVEQLALKAGQCVSQAQHIGGNQIIFDWDEALETMEEE